MVSEMFEDRLDKFLLTVNKCTDVKTAEECSSNDIDAALSKIRVNIIVVSQEYLQNKNLELDNDNFNSLSTTETLFLSKDVSIVSRNFISKSVITKQLDKVMGTDFLIKPTVYEQYSVFDQRIITFAKEPFSQAYSE